MKSAYELAMERLEKESPRGPELTADQKAEIADIDNRFQAKIAERKVLADGEMKNAQNPAELESIKQRMLEDVRRLEAECEEKKNQVRNNA